MAINAKFKSSTTKDMSLPAILTSNYELESYVKNDIDLKALESR